MGLKGVLWPRRSSVSLNPLFRLCQRDGGGTGESESSSVAGGDGKEWGR